MYTHIHICMSTDIYSKVQRLINILLEPGKHLVIAKVVISFRRLEAILQANTSKLIIKFTVPKQSKLQYNLSKLKKKGKQITTGWHNGLQVQNSSDVGHWLWFAPGWPDVYSDKIRMRHLEGPFSGHVLTCLILACCLVHNRPKEVLKKVKTL